MAAATIVLLKECIESLKNVNYKNYEIIIIDNQSTDNSLELLKDQYKEYDILYL